LTQRNERGKQNICLHLQIHIDTVVVFWGGCVVE
jgi:hypothetical protein